MNNSFDEFSKGLAQSVTRRRVLKNFGLGLAGLALACFGLANKASGGPTGTCGWSGDPCHNNSDCCSGLCLPRNGSKSHYRMCA